MTRMNRDELLSIVRKLKSGDYASDAERTRLVSVFERNVPHPNASDLIFFPMKDGTTPEQIVDEALSYRPIGLV